MLSKPMFLYVSAGTPDKVHILHKRVARDVHYRHLITQSFVAFFTVSGCNQNKHPRESLSLGYKRIIMKQTRAKNKYSVRLCII